MRRKRLSPISLLVPMGGILAIVVLWGINKFLLVVFWIVLTIVFVIVDGRQRRKPKRR